MKISRFLLVAALATGAVACSDDDGSDSGDTTTRPPSTSAAPATTPAPTTTGPSTTPAPSTTLAPSTTAPPTTPAGPTTTEACEPFTNLDPVEVDWPGTLSTLYGDDVDTGGHRCFERVVINFEGSGDVPGYSVQYMDDPLTLATSGQTTELRGGANLIITVGTWMGDLDAGGYTGPTQIFPDNVSNIEEVTLIDNFESVMIWGVGLDKVRAFEVFTLPDPFRLVIDISSVE